MSLIKWNENGLFPTFDTLWDDFSYRDFFNKNLQLGSFVPAVNSVETDSEFKLEIAAPGLKKEDFKINLDNNILTISSEKEEEKEEEEEKEGGKVTRKEFNYSSFERSFQLPENINTDSISAEYVDGLLKLGLPKKELTKAESKKQIKIK